MMQSCGYHDRHVKSCRDFNSLFLSWEVQMFHYFTLFYMIEKQIMIQNTYTIGNLTEGVWSVMKAKSKSYRGAISLCLHWGLP